jgi:hypothetical protein
LDERDISVYDQWKGQPVHKRLIRFEGGSGSARGSKSNDGKRFAVIGKAPPGGASARRRFDVGDHPLIKPLARVRPWWRSIESGQANSTTDLAEQEGVTDAYVCRLLPLTCLAPDIVEAILDGRQPKGLRLAEVLGNGPLARNAQRGDLRLQH